MENVKTVFVQRVEKPARKVILKRGVKARDYFAYCEEVGCDVWGTLTSMKSLCGEPVCLWLPPEQRAPGTSEYVQGVETAEDYDGPVPEGFDVIRLPAAGYLMFQGLFRRNFCCFRASRLRRRIIARPSGRCAAPSRSTTPPVWAMCGTARTHAYNWSLWVTGAILSCCPCGPQSAEPYREK